MDIWCSCSDSFQFHMLLYIVVWACTFGSGMVLVTCVDGWCRQTLFVCYDTMYTGPLVRLTLACCSLGNWSVGPLNLHFHLTSLLPFSTTLFDLVPHFDVMWSTVSFLCVQWNPRSPMLGELLVALEVRWVKYLWLTDTHFRWLQELCPSWWLRVAPPCLFMYIKGWVILYVLKVKVILMCSKKISYVFKIKVYVFMYIFNRQCHKKKR